MPEGFDDSPRPSPGATPAAAPGPEELPGPEADPRALAATLTLFQANLLVAMLGGFWGRKAEGHPGPDLLGRGLMELAVLVKWERLKAQRLRHQPQGQSQDKDPPPSSRARSRATPSQPIPTPPRSTRPA